MLLFSAMYWLDYQPPSRRKARRASLLTLGLIIGLFGAGLVSGWGSALFPRSGEAQLPQESDALPEPMTATNAVRVLDPVTGGATTGSTNTPAVNSAVPAAALQTVALDELAPDFTLPDLFHERTVYTLSDYRGHPVILNFWASWCLPCRREMPALQATAAGYEADGLGLLGMNQTYIDDLAEARTFVEELGLTFANTRDDSGAVGAGAYRVAGIPTSVFINREGEVVHIQIGEMSLEQITRYTDRLMAGQPLQP